VLNKKKNTQKFLFIFFITIFVFLADSNESIAKRKKSAKKSKISYELQVQKRKAERIQTLYKHFPIYEQWERSEVYPYNDFNFLNNFDNNSIFESFNNRKLLLARINDWLGVRYRLPGRSKRGVDCSNFVSIILEETLGLQIPAGAATQATLFPKIEKMEDLQFGDLVFFSGRRIKAKRIGHVGIYIGNGLFVHSQTSSGVIYTLLSDGYYTARYRFGARIPRTDLALLTF
jgi:hypothetical protein